MKRQGHPKGPAAQAHAARKACQPYLTDIQRAEKAKKLPAGTLEALIWSESRCNPTAENKRTRARGLGQHVPSGAAAVGRIQRERGEVPWFTYARTLDPVASIRAAAELLAFGLDVCGSLVRAVGFYNSGHCVSNAFARRVLRLADALRWVAGWERVRELEAFMRHLRRESTRTLDDEREPRDWDMMYARWRHQQPRAARPVGERAR